MKIRVDAILKDCLKSEITVYTTGLKARGTLYFIDTYRRLIGIKQSDNKKLLIDIKAINAIELGDEQ